MAVGKVHHGIGDLIKLERLGEGTYGTVFKVFILVQGYIFFISGYGEGVLSDLPILGTL